jgi:hypothetical protein
MGRLVYVRESRDLASIQEPQYGRGALHLVKEKRIRGLEWGIHHVDVEWTFWRWLGGFSIRAWSFLFGAWKLGGL